MAEVQIKRVSVRHDAIMDFMLVNPTVSLGAVAAQFGVTQAWLSVVIHSDAFQRQLEDKKGELFGAVVVPLRTKITGLASLALDKLGEALENCSPVTDKDFIASTADSVLKNLGYSPKSVPVRAPGIGQQNIFVVDKDSLAAARENMRAASSASNVVIEGQGEILEQIEGTPTLKIQTGGGSGLGEVEHASPAVLDSAEADERG